MRKNFNIQRVVIEGVLPERCGKCWLSIKSPHPAFSRICLVANGAITPFGESSGRPDWCPLETHNSDYDSDDPRLHDFLLKKKESED